MKTIVAHTLMVILLLLVTVQQVLGDDWLPGQRLFAKPSSLQAAEQSTDQVPEQAPKSPSTRLDSQASNQFEHQIVLFNGLVEKNGGTSVWVNALPLSLLSPIAGIRLISWNSVTTRLEIELDDASVFSLDVGQKLKQLLQGQWQIEGDNAYISK